MNVLDVIEQIKKLPPEEQAQVIEYIEELKGQNTIDVRHLDDKTFKRTADKVFSKHAKLFEKLAK